MSLENLIVSEIRDNGPISIYRFMEECLYNDQFGYYSSKENMIGATGDFITSPEISQVFGELIGAWLAQTWIDRGKPKPFNLVELGPGTGTLMKDILRILVPCMIILSDMSFPSKITKLYISQSLSKLSESEPPIAIGKVLGPIILRISSGFMIDFVLTSNYFHHSKLF